MLDLTRQRKRISCFFSAIMAMAICCFSTSCNGVDYELIPKRNPLLVKLLNDNNYERYADAYLELTALLDNHDKDKLEKYINHTIKDIKKLCKYVYTHLIKRKLYNELLKVPDLDAKALEKEKRKLTHQTQIDKWMEEQLPPALRKLSEANIKELYMLSKNQLKELLEAEINKEKDKQATAVTPPTADKQEAAAATTLQQTINHIKRNEPQPQTDTKPKDDWGKKLPLQEPQRGAFFKIVRQFVNEDQEYLKKLFNDANKESIVNFLDVYYDEQEFNTQERVALLETLIYLYKRASSLCIKMCNDPESLELGDQLSIFHKCTDDQVALLSKLRDALS